MANHLGTEKKIVVAKMLLEGCSVRAVERMTGTHRDTVCRLLKRIGDHCEQIIEREVTGFIPSSLQVDELWAYISKKERHLRPGDPREFGDAYTYLAVDRETKLIPAFDVGKRDEPTTDRFIASLARRIDGDVQIFTDGWGPYRTSIPRHFGRRAHFAQIVKHFGEDADERHRYSPPRVRSIEHVWIQGFPMAGQVSTSHVERHNWTLRTHLRRFTRLSNGFSRKLENLRAAVAMYVCWFNWCKIHGSLRMTPAMAAGLASSVWPIERIIPN